MARQEVERVLAALHGLRPQLITQEFDLHALVERTLRSAGIPFVHEFRLGPRDRLDFLADGGVAIECKKGKPNGPSLLRQIGRYCAHGEVRSLIVVTPWRRHVHVEPIINGREVVYLSLNELWGIAI